MLFLGHFYIKWQGHTNCDKTFARISQGLYAWRRCSGSEKRQREI
jgi:hypothetical protein